ncbi:calcium-binding protein [Dankookia sp. P2]|uniref:calcium-binding protein n=1 Tax=Dankookia sp. P2 TaxID=3423955 RepID=UPI003D675240
MAYVDPKPPTSGTASGDFMSGGSIAYYVGSTLTTAPKAPNGPVDFVPNTTVGTDGLDSPGAVRFLGLDGNDTLYGTVHSDTLVGGQGNDLLRGGAGCDQLWGGTNIANANDGNDTFYFKAGDLGTKFASGTVLTAADYNLATCGDMIMDFHSRTLGNTSNQDFISFNGFGAGSITKLGVAPLDSKADVYKVTWADGGMNLFSVRTTGIEHKTLLANDYHFY